MEEYVTLNFYGEDINPKQLSPATLAFVGDAVFELLVREYIVAKNGSMPVAKLHKKTVKHVCASWQFKASVALEPVLSEDELNMYRRGRNSTGSHVPRNSTPKEYRAATGVECLFGFLYFNGNIDRLHELFNYVINYVDV